MFELVASKAFEKAAETALEKNSIGKLELPHDRGDILSTEKLNLPKLEIREVASNGTEFSRIPRTGGEWEGTPGDSTWKPDPDYEPGDRSGGTNPDHRPWRDILAKYETDGVPFKDGHPDFSEFERCTVEIDDFSDDRASNFDQADEKLAEIKGCTPEEVAKWRKENAHTWHECEDCKTMQKVPREIHGNIPHSGGIAEIKARNNETDNTNA